MPNFSWLYVDYEFQVLKYRRWCKTNWITTYRGRPGNILITFRVHQPKFVEMLYAYHRQRISNSWISQCVQNTFKNDRKMDVSFQYHGHIGVGNQLKCVPQAVTLQQAPNPCLHWHVMGRIARKPDRFSSVGCLSTQTFLCVAYLQKYWYVSMNIHCVICFQILRYRFIYFPYVDSAYSARFLCGNTFTDSLTIALSPTNSTNPISKAIATLVTQPTKLGGGGGGGGHHV